MKLATREGVGDSRGGNNKLKWNLIERPDVEEVVSAELNTASHSHVTIVTGISEVPSIFCTFPE